MFSSNILCFMSNFSFKGDTLYRSIPSGWIDLFIPPDSLKGDTISRDTGTKQKNAEWIHMVTKETQQLSGECSSNIHCQLLYGRYFSDLDYQLLYCRYFSDINFHYKGYSSAILFVSYFMADVSATLAINAKYSRNSVIRPCIC